MARNAGRFQSRLTTTLILGLVAALAVTGFSTSPAGAVDYPAATGLTPTSGEVATNPVLTWNRVAGAPSYRVELSTSETFSTLIAGAGTSSTVNVHHVPAVQLPAGTIHWRVAANGGSLLNWSIGQFTKSAIDVPQLLTPADGDTVHAPTQPEAYSWQQVPGATGYTLQIGDDASFTDPARYKTYTTQRASYALKTLPAAGTKYWRVQAVLGPVKSEWSPVRTVHIGLFDLGVPQLPTTPENDPNFAVEDVVLDWQPIAGAATYELQVARDDQFLNLAHTRSGIVSSRYSPPGVLANDQYWWRIRPVDAAGHAAAWMNMPVWVFQRHWAGQAHLQYPANGATLTRADRLFFQWSGVHLATRYRLDLSTTPDFTLASTVSCTTVNTTLVTNSDTCAPAPGTTYYWRVVASDSPAAGSDTPQTNPLAADAEVRSFTYMPNVVVQTTPADGSSVDVPTLRWNAVSGAMRYRVQVWTVSGVAKVNQLTFGTSLTPRVMLEPGTTYRWQVVAYNAAGDAISNPTIDVFQPTFTVVAQLGPTGATPDPLVTLVGPSPRPPTLNWLGVPEATKYSMWVKRAENPTWTQVADTIVYPAWESVDAQFLAAGTYDFYVQAYNGSTPIATGSTGQFTVAPPRTVVGHEAALVGTDLGGDATRSCDAQLPNTCQNLRQTPVLAWDPDPDAGLYQLILSADPVLTDLGDRRINVYGTAWTDVATLIDANATSGTHWAVISCVTPTICPVKGPAEHVFNKQAPTVELATPVATAAEDDEVVLSWHDWLARPGASNGSTPLTATAPTTEALYYRVQTSTTSTFTSLLDNVVVDQTSYTSFTRVYPEGPIHWRVQAYDGSGRASAWSASRSFEVTSLAPAPTTPTTGGALAPGSSFTWQPKAMSASYELRVLKNDGTNIDTAPSSSIAHSATGIQQTSYAPTASLPVIDPPAGSNDNYRWYIRRNNVSGGIGPWSAGVPFRVVGQAPTLLAPAAGATVHPRGAVFSWDAVPGAARYRFEHRPVGGAIAGADTVARSFAPSTALPTGSREWRVVAYDSTGHLLGASAWRAYSAPWVAGTVAISGNAVPGGTLTATASFTPAPVTLTYQWFAGTTAITGATSATYSVKSTDVGKSLTVKVTGSKPGYDSITVPSNAMTASTGPTVRNTALPTITGTTRIGYVLTASRGSWSPTPESFQFQWLRNGAAIPGATAATYRVTRSDPGRYLSVRVIARKAGYNPAVARSANKLIPRVASRSAAVFVDNTITVRAYPRMRVTVTAPGIVPTGVIRVYEGTRLLKSVTLTASHTGRIYITLPKRSAGRHYLHARYLGSSFVAPSRSANIALYVRR